MTEKQILEGLMSCVTEKMRLATLTNQQLAKEALDAGLCDIFLIDEMMTRLDPHWAHRNLETGEIETEESK